MRLSFALPPAGDTATLDKFLVLTMLLVDLLGSYKPSPGEWPGWLTWHCLAAVVSTFLGLTVPVPCPLAHPRLCIPSSPLPCALLQSS